MCPPFRRHLDIGLEQKGYGNTKSVFEYPSQPPRSRNTPNSSNYETTDPFSTDELPPQHVTSTLMDIFYERIYFIFPILSREDLEAQVMTLTSSENIMGQSDFLPVFYGVLAVAALSIPGDHQMLKNEAFTGRQGSDLAAIFFERSTKFAKSKSSWSSQHLQSRRTEPRAPRNLNNVTALALQAAYMASIGNQAEAWISIGQAARLGQDIGLHVSICSM